MSGPKTNERPRGLLDADFDEGTRAVLRHARVAPNKVREVLNLVRDLPVRAAEDVLRFSERDAAILVGKVLASAIANAEHNDEMEPEELYISACFADEGTTIKRWRPRARGRATRIRKRTSHITVIVSRLPEDRLQRLAAHRRAEQLAARARRVAGGRRGAAATEDGPSRAERRRRARGGEVETASDVEVAEDEGIVDVDEAAVAAAGDEAAAPRAEDDAEIVDTDAEAVEALDEAEASGEADEIADAEGVSEDTAPKGATDEDAAPESAEKDES